MTTLFEPFVHVYMNAPDDFDVWLDSDVTQSRTGLCIGHGITEIGAIADAEATLEIARDQLADYRRSMDRGPRRLR
jgi:hypothetical protein